MNGLQPFERTIEQTTETMPPSHKTVTAAARTTNRITSLWELLQYRSKANIPEVMKTGSANLHFLSNFSQLPLPNISSFTDYSFRDLCGCRQSYIIFADPVFKKPSIYTIVVTMGWQAHAFLSKCSWKFCSHHRKHTILLSRERVNKGTILLCRKTHGKIARLLNYYIE